MDTKREDFAEPGGGRTPLRGTLVVIVVLATLAALAFVVLGVIALFVWWIQPFIDFD